MHYMKSNSESVNMYMENNNNLCEEMKLIS